MKTPTKSDADELAMHTRRLVRAVRKHEPESRVAASAVRYLLRTGRPKGGCAWPIRDEKNT